MERLGHRMIVRTLTTINVVFDVDGNPRVNLEAVIQETTEGISQPRMMRVNNPTIVAAAASLRDAVVAFALAAGKPVTPGIFESVT